MKKLPITIPHSVAQHYHHDARDFAARFDTLWEDQLHKTGRIKSFVDLAMGCECALKCHVFLGYLSQDPIETYRLVRRAGHNSAKLAALANYLEDRALYERVGEKLAPFSVFVRYSLDAYATFFPALADWADAPINHAATIGSHPWVMELRGELEDLIVSATPEVSGIVEADLTTIIRHEQEMEAFMRAVAPNNSLKADVPNGPRP